MNSSNYILDVEQGAIRAVLDRSRNLKRRIKEFVGGREAAASFPNDLGGYRGKRPERPLVAPLAPRERFARLAAAYLAKRRNYRFLRGV